MLLRLLFRKLTQQLPSTIVSRTRRSSIRAFSVTRRVRNKLSSKYDKIKTSSLAIKTTRIHYKPSSTYFIYCAAASLSICGVSTLYTFHTDNKSVIAAVPSPPTAVCPPWDYSWDGRDGIENETLKKSVRTITLIRHGQYVHAKGSENKILTDLGRKQAKITGGKLKALNTKYDHIYCSGMVRAKETADIIMNELYDNTDDSIDIIYDSNLNEGAPSQIIPARQSLTDSGFFDNVEEDSRRISTAFEVHIHRNDNDTDEQVLIIGHGNVFRYFVCRVLQIPPQAWLRFAFANCSITRFKIYGNGKVSIQCIGNDGHFEEQYVTYN